MHGDQVVEKGESGLANVILYTHCDHLLWGLEACITVPAFITLRLQQLLPQKEAQNLCVVALWLVYIHKE